MTPQAEAANAARLAKVADAGADLERATGWLKAADETLDASQLITHSEQSLLEASRAAEAVSTQPSRHVLPMGEARVRDIDMPWSRLDDMFEIREPHSRGTGYITSFSDDIGGMMTIAPKPKPSVIAGVERATVPASQISPLARVSTREQFRRNLLKLAQAHPDELGFLIDPKTSRFYRSERGMGMDKWMENPLLWEVGHIESAKNLLGRPDRYAVMTKFENRLLSATIEHPGIGGAMLNSGQVLLIHGFPFDLKSAYDMVLHSSTPWRSMPRQIFENAPLIRY